MHRIPDESLTVFIALSLMILINCLHVICTVMYGVSVEIQMTEIRSFKNHSIFLFQIFEIRRSNDVYM